MNADYATLQVPSLSLLRRNRSGAIGKSVVAFTRAAVCRALRRGVVKGCIDVIEADRKHRFGLPVDADAKTANPERSPHIIVYVKDESFWVRVYMSYDIGFSEAFMNQEFTCTPSIKEALNFFVDNRRSLNELSSPMHKLRKAVDILMHRYLTHGLRISKSNAAGYDASNDLFRAFLSQELQYSCPIWSDEEGGVRGDLDGHSTQDALESAQARKINYMLRKARLRSGHRLLEIGSGWGSLAIEAGRLGCRVDTLTLSTEQKALADERIAAAGLAERVRVHLMDYRNMPPEFESAFDACISVEMLEAVGVKYMPLYLKKIDWALKDDHATVVLTATTYPDATFTLYQGNNFIRKYHWPHTILPSATWLANEVRKVLKGRLCLETLDDFGTHYPRCLREWSRRLSASWDDKLVRSLQERYPALKDEHQLRVYRLRWLYMFVYMEIAYSRVVLSLNCWTFVRPGYASVASA